MILTSLLNSLFLVLSIIYFMWSLTTEYDPTNPSNRTFKSIVSLKDKPKIPKVENDLPPEFTKIEKGPFIGVLTMPCPVIDRIPGTAVIPSSYIKWLESAGAVVVPIPFHISKPRLEVLFKNLNGLVITGGRALLWKEVKDEILDEDDEGNSNLNPPNATADDGGDEKTLVDDPGNDNSTFSESNYNTTVEIETNTTKPKKFRRTRFAKSISHFIKLALKASVKGDHFPILGICLGMEGIILHFERSLSKLKFLRKVDLTRRDYIEGVGRFTRAAPNSKLYRNFKGDLKDLTERVFYYHHQYGIDYENIVNKFEGGIQPLSYFYDNSKRKYITSFEFNNHPIFGIQYHPEKAAYEWKVKMNRTKTAQKVSADIAYNFVQECKKNNHTFNLSRFEDLLSYHFNTTDHSSIYNQIYKIPYKVHNKFPYFIKTNEQENVTNNGTSNISAINPEILPDTDMPYSLLDPPVIDNNSPLVDALPDIVGDAVNNNLNDVAQSDGNINVIKDTNQIPQELDILNNDFIPNAAGTNF